MGLRLSRDSYPEKSLADEIINIKHYSTVLSIGNH